MRFGAGAGDSLMIGDFFLQLRLLIAACLCFSGLGLRNGFHPGNILRHEHGLRLYVIPFRVKSPYFAKN
jgi:hypothetical protein